MGYSKKHQIEEPDNKRWVIAGIGIRAPLKPISIKFAGTEESRDEGACRTCTTPTARESRISERLPCPPAPRKRRPASTCHFNVGREFFNPPDLESIFICHNQRANS